MMYQITSAVTRTVGAWTSTRDLPTFYLHPDVQGIVSEDHARRIAERMLADVAGPGATVNVQHVTRLIEP